jgi:apolipoprotein N-acyltransferase
VQIASLGGVYAVSFVLVAVNAALAGFVAPASATSPARGGGWRGLGVAAALVVTVVGFGMATLRAGSHMTSAPPVPIALVQADVDAAARWGAEGAARTLAAYQRLTADAFTRGRPAIVFWPEAAVTFFLEQDALYGRALTAAFAERDAELVIGAPRAGASDGGPPYANSVYLLAPGGTIAARYDKQYLLPFMEYFPLRLALAQRRFGRVREFTPGAPTPPLPTRAGRAGVLVCNEAFLPHVAARRIAEGADYLVNPSNDSWVPNAGFAEQQFDIVSLRAVEQRAWLVRVSDSGPSGVVDPYGRVTARSDPLTRAVLAAEIAPARPSSVYGAVGDLFGIVCAIAVAVALIVRRVR